MATSAEFPGDIVVGGRGIFGSLTLPVNSVGDAVMDTADPVDIDKYISRIVRDYWQPSGVAVIDEVCPIFLARAAGAVTATIKAALVVACIGDSTIDVTIKKNGVSVTGTPISFDSGDIAFANVSGVLNSTAVAAGDVFTVDVNATVGTGTLGQGLIVSVDFKVNPFST